MEDRKENVEELLDEIDDLLKSIGELRRKLGESGLPSNVTTPLYGQLATCEQELLELRQLLVENPGAVDVAGAKERLDSIKKCIKGVEDMIERACEESGDELPGADQESSEDKDRDEDHEKAKNHEEDFGKDHHEEEELGDDFDEEDQPEKWERMRNTYEAFK